ncbi:MAG: hypothetical protein LUD77_09510 [Clostridiales bacterium]|nr:hypothetical protein [Clostridiales bacterium]
MDTMTKLTIAARQNKEIKEAMLKTREEADPAVAFCKKATELGFPVTLGDLLSAESTTRGNLLKSCNGGADGPLDGWGDVYEEFFAAIKY